MLNVEKVPTTGDDHDKRILGAVVYMRTPIRISWDKSHDTKENTAVENICGNPVYIHNQEESRARKTLVYNASDKSIQPPFWLFHAIFCKTIWFHGRVELPKGAEEFVSLDRTRTRLEARDGFLLQYYAYANMTEVDVYEKIEN